MAFKKIRLLLILTAIIVPVLLFARLIINFYLSISHMTSALSNSLNF